ncbi:hypothetical protein AZI86_09235 [Bdellovibrio bacteriovorus]|uniref:Uncharacterized protein n=1 Tax=Bdellovibrio bacteriovorus TaxID=959 RepID=A0A150WRU5_BDEBC|nr:hypothetical protein [Bdellovibrio bacteriovorus]KYG67182.1 hypothetical protein AZI86_09235 [Bdellovibrio bacteriovorus]
MKKLILGLVISLMASQTFAAAREFRVLTGHTKGGLALAWGLKGQAIDFEKMDKKSHDEQWDFFFKNEKNAENYLVDLKTMQILAVVREGSEDSLQGTIAEFSEMINTNHNDLRLVYDENSKIGVTAGYAKWFGGLETIFALKENAYGQNEVIGSCNQDCENTIIMPAMKAQMTKEQIKDFESYDAQNSFYEVTTDKKTGRIFWKVTITSETPKSDKGTSYSGLMTLTFEGGKFKAVFGKVVKNKN